MAFPVGGFEQKISRMMQRAARHMPKKQRLLSELASIGSGLKTLCVFATLAIGGCATSGAIDSVRIAATADQVSECRFLGRTLGAYTLAAALQPGGMRANATRQIVVGARRLGGNVVLVDPASTAGAGTAIAADVFLC